MKIFHGAFSSTSMNINAKESRPYKLSLSWGTAMYHPASPMSLDQLIATADELMYAQKKAKSNRKILVA